jgi:hypothetical protein
MGDMTRVFTDISEGGVDLLSADPIVQGFPVLATVVAFAKGAYSIPDRLFAAKVLRCVAECKDALGSRSAELLSRIQEDPEARTKAGEVVVFAIDRAEGLQKAAMLGRLLAAYMERTVDFPTFRRLLAAVDRAYIDDLCSFPTWALDDKMVDGFEPTSLEAAGLTRMVMPGINIPDDSENLPQDWHITPLGKHFAEILYGHCG